VMLELKLKALTTLIIAGKVIWIQDNANLLTHLLMGKMQNQRSARLLNAMQNLHLLITSSAWIVWRKFAWSTGMMTSINVHISLRINRHLKVNCFKQGISRTSNLIRASLWTQVKKCKH
jgi:hypothetical protein